MRRRAARTLVAVVVAVAVSFAFGPPWTWINGGFARAPSIKVISRADDPRLAVVAEAAQFWDRTLAGLGTPFRLGPIDRVTSDVPAEDLRALSAAAVGWSSSFLSRDGLRGAWLRQHPAPFDRFPGDLLIVLSDASFISFSSRIGDRRLVAIKSGDLPPLTMPNVLRNVIAHELGHALGLGHNADPTTLMCGRPAPCRPAIYVSAAPRFFPLTEGERERLRGLYPLPQ